MIRVLHIVGAMYPGGMENFIMNLYDKIDRERFQFDFIIHDERENDYRPLIEAMGGRVYLLPRLVCHPAANLRQLHQIVKENNYRIVVRHTANALIAPQLWAAKQAGAVSICHAHSETDDQLLVHKLGRSFMGRVADRRLACSPRAGQWMYGTRDFQVIRNAIVVERFEYGKEKAEKIRQEFGIGDRPIYGHIGNLVSCKNHLYLLKVFKEILKIQENAVLFCVGEGEMRPVLEAKIRELNLEGKVILTGMRKDAECFMSCFDVLLFPSIYEGLPLTLIEAQAAGLPAVISANITKEVSVTKGLIYHHSIEDVPKQWAKQAVELQQQFRESDRICQRKELQAAGYDMNHLAKWYESYFTECASHRNP